MDGNIAFTVCSLFFDLLLLILFFSKKKLKSIENNILAILIILNLIGSIVQILCGAITPMKSESVSSIIFCKIYLVYLLSFLLLFIIYLYIILRKSKGKIIEFNRIYSIIGVYAVCIIILIFLPISIYNEDQIIYTYGPSVDFIYIISEICMTAMFICLLVNFKVVFEKKYLPIFLFLGIGTIVAIIQSINPELLLMTSMETFILFLMYHTIENPDLQMIREFHKIREKEEKSNDSKNEFLVNISKEIKTPIANIKTITSEALNSNDPEVLKNEIRRIQTSTGELSQLVSNILDITDMEKQKLGIKMNKYQVYNLFNVINKTFEKTIDDNIEYRFHYDMSIPEYLYGDSIRLKQIMNILLENAREYTKKGFIEVNVNSIIKNDICRLVITIEDSGSGMTIEELEHLFDKEKIYSDETLKLIDDTKNNLGIAKSLVDLMNGSITVKSELGNGSKFTIVIDQIIKQEEKTKIEETVDQYEKMLEKKKKILLVISSQDLSKKINLCLKKQPYDVVEVVGGQQCLERLRNKEKYNIIIMEEKLSSEDTLIKIKDTPGYKIPVILISDNKGFGAKEIYQEKGFKDVIFMPIKKNELIENIKKNIN